MARVSTGHGSVAAGTAILIKAGRSVTYSVLGTHNATVNIERSDDGGTSWEVVQSVATTATISPTTIINEHKDRLYRSNCTVYTSGTATAVVKDATNEHTAAGTVPTAGVTAYETADAAGIIRRTVLECNSVALSVADDAGVAQYGGVQVYDFPEGMICCLGAQMNGTLTMGVTGTIIDAWTGVCALGTVTATTGATLVSTEATWLQSVAIGAATSKVGTIDAVSVATALTEAGARWVDGTATAADMYLNFAIADDVTHTAATGTFTGTIEFIWMTLGDN